MAKKSKKDAGEEPTNHVSAALRRQIENIKRPFRQYVEGFAALAVSRAELAPRFMVVCRAWQAATGGPFVAFVRELDPSVPADRDAYRANSVYQAADYLRRLVGRTDTGAGAKRTKPVRGNLNALARLLATILPIVRNGDEVWAGVESEFQFTKRQVTRLKQVVAATRPFLTVNVPRPLPARIVHIPVTPEQTAQAA